MNNLILKLISLKEDYFSKKLEEYFSGILQPDTLGFIPPGVTSVEVSNVRKLSTRVMRNRVYSFTLSYQKGEIKQRSAFILKAYGKSSDTIEKDNNASENLERGLKEFQVLTFLKRVGFPVPKACLFKSDIAAFGTPFIVMEKEELTQNFSNIGSIHKESRLASQFRYKYFRYYRFSKRLKTSMTLPKKCLVNLKIFRNMYPSRNKRLEQNFELVIRWLESNISNNYCDRLSSSSW